MSVVRPLGKPDLFITFTCNPKWVEIEIELQPGQDAKDRPDLLCRIFKLKLRSVMTYLKKIFGKVIMFGLSSFKKEVYLIVICFLL